MRGSIPPRATKSTAPELVVRQLAFQAGGSGSNPVGVTKEVPRCGPLIGRQFWELDQGGLIPLAQTEK